MKDKIEACYNRLQTLNIKSTESNMETLLQTLYDLKDVYNTIEQKVEEDGRQTVDSEQ